MSTLKQFLYDKSNKSEVDQYFEDQARFLIEKQKLETIDNFNGYFDFLNNDFPCPVYYDGLIHKSVSHAYQAARSKEQHIREKIARADTLVEMYEIAAKIEDPPDWLKNRLKVMETLIRDKFRRNPELRDKLKATEKRTLVNSYADATTSNLFWGMVDGKGQNQIGRILESVRNDIQHNMELEKWIFMTFSPEDNVKLLPGIELECAKADNSVENIKLDKKNTYFLGKLVGSDVLMTHASISRRHAALICNSFMGVCLIDVGSKGGSFINGKKCDNCVPYRLKQGDMLNFGSSTRRYKISIDIGGVERYLNQKKREMSKKAEQMEALNNPDANPNALKASLGVVVNDQVFVAGLPENVSHKDVEKFFEQFGEIKDVVIPQDKKTGKTKNFGFVTYVNPKDCEKAIAQDGVTFKDRKLKIRHSEKRGYEDQRTDDKVDRSKKEKYAEDIKGYKDRARRDVEKRHRRRSSRSRSRSPRDRDRDSRRRRDDDDKRSRRRSSRDRSKERERRRKRRSKSKSRSRSRSRSKSSSKSGSDKKGKSSSPEKEKEKAKEQKEKEETKKEEVKKDNKPRNKEEVEKRKPKKRSESDSRSRSRSRSRSKSKDQGKKKNGSKKNRDDSRDRREKDKKKRAKSESESSSGSESDSSSSSSESKDSKDSDSDRK